MNQPFRTVSLALLLGLGILFSACGPATMPVTDTATSSQTSMLPSNTPTIRPQRTQTFTPILNTPNPSEQTYTAIATYFDCRYEHNPRNFSPDGTWLFCYDDLVLNRNGQAWSIRWVELLGGNLRDYHGYSWVVHWSQDNQFLYFAPASGQDGIVPLPRNAFALFRMDLTTGEVSTILPPGDPGTGREYVLSISPTGRRLAYIYYPSYPTYPSTSPDSTTIHLLDLRTGETREVVLQGNWQGVGWFHWSEAGLRLMFMAEDRMSSHYYYLTYDVISLQFIRSEPYTPWWVEDIPQSQPYPEETPIP